VKPRHVLTAAAVLALLGVGLAWYGTVALEEAGRAADAAVRAELAAEGFHELERGEPEVPDVPEGARVLAVLEGESRPREAVDLEAGRRAARCEVEPERAAEAVLEAVRPAPENLGAWARAEWVEGGGGVFGRLRGGAWIAWGDDLIATEDLDLGPIDPPPTTPGAEDPGPRPLGTISADLERALRWRPRVELRAGLAGDLDDLGAVTWSAGATVYPHRGRIARRIGYAADLDGNGAGSLRVAISVGRP
jgi:hypothetical protein